MPELALNSESSSATDSKTWCAPVVRGALFREGMDRLLKHEVGGVSTALHGRDRPDRRLVEPAATARSPVFGGVPAKARAGDALLWEAARCGVNTRYPRGRLNELRIGDRHVVPSPYLMPHAGPGQNVGSGARGRKPATIHQPVAGLPVGPTDIDV